MTNSLSNMRRRFCERFLLPSATPSSTYHTPSLVLPRRRVQRVCPWDLPGAASHSIILDEPCCRDPHCTRAPAAPICKDIVLASIHIDQGLGTPPGVPPAEAEVSMSPAAATTTPAAAAAAATAAGAATTTTTTTTTAATTANGNLAVAAPNGSSELTPIANRQTASRSTNLQRRFSPMRVDPTVAASPVAADEEPADDGSSWNHGAIGPAAGGGKTGRVIAKLQADNDRLQRELRAERMYLEQSESENRMYKETVEALRAENSNLQQAKEVDEGIIKRRDRVIEDSRAELEIERNRRIHAERTARDMVQEKNDAIGNMQAEVSRERDIARHATGHADVLQQSHRQLNSEYRTRIESVTKDLNALIASRDDERARLARLEVIQEQSAHELERANRTNSSMQSLYSAHKEQAQQVIRTLHAEAEEMRHEYNRVVGRAASLVDEVQWLLRVNKMHEDGTISTKK